MRRALKGEGDLDANTTETAFERLCSRAMECKKCTRMSDSVSVLSLANGSPLASIMFIGEAPGRLGADQSSIPFHGDVSGDFFEHFLDVVGISRYESFVTNAVLCNPKDAEGNNATPTSREMDNCSSYLRAQIEIINPRIVVTLGSKALDALAAISPHELTLSSGVRTANNWFGRILIPLYHPGRRAQIHRSLANQLSDYQFVAETLRRQQHKTRIGDAGRQGLKLPVLSVVREMLTHKAQIGYFALHKLFYLVEQRHVLEHGTRLTNSYIVRQKDGPYCVDLHYGRLKRTKEILIRSIKGELLIAANDVRFDLFNDMNTSYESRESDVLAQSARAIIQDVVKKYGELSDEKIKTAVYLTAPMKSILRLERTGINCFNRPIDFMATSGR